MQKTRPKRNRAVEGGVANDLTEAKMNAVPASGSEIIRVENYDNANVNTVTVRVLRIWR